MRHPRHDQSPGGIVLRIIGFLSEKCVKHRFHDIDTCIFLLDHKLWNDCRLINQRYFGRLLSLIISCLRLLPFVDHFLLVYPFLEPTVPLFLWLSILCSRSLLPINTTVEHLFGAATVTISLILVLLVHLIPLLCHVNAAIGGRLEDIPLLLLSIATQVIVDAWIINLRGVELFLVGRILSFELVEGSVIVHIFQRF